MEREEGEERGVLKKKIRGCLIFGENHKKTTVLIYLKNIYIYIFMSLALAVSLFRQYATIGYQLKSLLVTLTITFVL